MKRHRLAVPAAAALLALSGCGSSSPAPGQATADPTPTERPTERPADRSGEGSAGDGPPVVVFLGDSFTVGVGGSGYVELTGQALGWTAVAAAQSGTGYVNASARAGQEPYGDRVDDVVEQQPDVVVVQGSTNDVGSTNEEVATAARELYRELAEALPDAQVVVLGPTGPPRVPAEGVRAIRDAVAGAAAEAGLPFLDPLAEEWLVPTDRFYTDDGIHPDDEGYAELSRRLAAALPELVPAD